MKKLLACAAAAALLGIAAPAQRLTPPANGAIAALSLPAPLPDRFASVEAPTRNIRLKIMPLGDSITWGTRDPSYGGYRHLLGTLLASDGYSINFVGSRQSGTGVTAGPNNEGHPGWTIPQMKDGIDSEGWLEKYRPDIILLHIGTNDIHQGIADSAPANLSALLDDILTRLPKAHVIVAQIIPFRRGADQDHRSYNAAIPGIVTSKGPRVSSVDMQDILSPGDYADGIHPNAGGYDKMARAWESAIRAVVSGSTPHPDAQPPQQHATVAAQALAAPVADMKPPAAALRTVAYAPPAAAAAPGAAPGRAAKPPKRPNIVFILTDDLSTNLIQYMPNVLAMQKEGTTFSNYFVTDSLCCPSRSSIFTGKFPHNTGVFTNTGADGGYEAFMAHGNEPHTFAVALQRGGYKTAMLGKYLNGYHPRKDRAATGWNEWDVAGAGYPEFNYVLNQNGRVARYGGEPKDYLTDVVAGLGEAFIHKSSRGPFFIEIATFAPHGPYIPAPRDADKFPGLTAPRSPAFGARPGPDAPNWLKEIPPLRTIDIQAINKAFRMRAQSVQAVDKMIGDIRSTLAALGLDQNTYVFFSSDNGLHMGEYSLRPGKMTPFEIDMHVPLIVVGPGVPKGQVVNEIVENIDLCPTFTELAESSSPTSPDGHSLVPLLQGNAVEDWRHVALIEHHHHGPVPDPNDPDSPQLHAANPPAYEALRTENSTYVEYEGGEVGYYDLIRDPDELTNVAASLPAAQRQRLHDILRANKGCQGGQACWDAQRLTPFNTPAASQVPPHPNSQQADDAERTATPSSATNGPGRVATAPPVAAAPEGAATASAATAPALTAPSATTTTPVIRFIPRSTAKVEQLIGDEDKERHQPTLSQTVTRYQLQGTDLGYSFEHDGRAYFLFGDTMGRLDRALDTIATTDARDPELGVRLDFLTVGSDYLTIRPPGISMGPFEVPVSGISLGGQMYVVVSTNHSPDRSTDRSVLTKFTPPATFKPLRTISQIPNGGRFIKMSLHTEPGPGPLAGLPSGGPFILMWGTGVYRKSDAYLAIVPAANFETGKGTRYFAGLDAAGAPVWSENESDAKPIVENGTIGDLSVTWCKDLGQWLMTYDSRAPAPRGVLFSYSRTPWGPWSEPQIIFNGERDGALGKFIHNPASQPDDGLAGPVVGKGQANPRAVHGGAYAPYVVERFTKLAGSELTLYYVLSTWNPYVVVLMKSRLHVE